MTINVHIERLVIDDPGVDPHRAGELKTAVRAELVRRLQAHGTGPALHDSKRLDGGCIVQRETQSPRRYGQQIGAAVFRSIGR